MKNHLSTLSDGVSGHVKESLSDMRDDNESDIMMYFTLFSLKER